MTVKLNLRSPIRPDWNLDPDDVLLTKGALNRLGYYEVPDWGTTPYPDASMFDGIKSFQRREKLDIDGVMNPDGPTIERLGHALTRNLTGDNDNCPNCGGQHSEQQHEAGKKADCESQLLRDEAICRMLPRPLSRARCWETAKIRNNQCKAGMPLTRLVVVQI